MTATLPDDLLALPSYVLSLVGREARSGAVAALTALDLRLDDLAVLATVGDGATQRQLTDVLRKDPSDVVRLLDHLEARGLLTRRRDAADRRRHVVELTPDGDALRARGLAACATAGGALLAPLTGAERTTLLSLLIRVAAAADDRVATD